VLSHAVWTQHFGASPDVIGRTAQIDRESYTIIGVLQQDFQPGAVARCYGRRSRCAKTT
jgi:hypothetical protein